MWINHVRDKGRNLRYCTLYQIFTSSKQLIVEWIAAGLMSLHEKFKLIYKSFLDTRIINNLNDANYHMIWSKGDIKKTFDGKDEMIFLGLHSKIYHWCQSKYK